eukprot:4281555-Amphidinium_carterae.1
MEGKPLGFSQLGGCFIPGQKEQRTPLEATWRTRMQQVQKITDGRQEQHLQQPSLLCTTAPRGLLAPFQRQDADEDVEESPAGEDEAADMEESDPEDVEGEAAAGRKDLLLEVARALPRNDMDSLENKRVRMPGEVMEQLVREWVATRIQVETIDLNSEEPRTEPQYTGVDHGERQDFPDWRAS